MPIIFGTTYLYLYTPSYTCMRNNIIESLKSIGIPNENIETLYWVIVTIGIILLFYCCRVVSRRMIVPLIRKVTRRTKSQWDDILLNDDTIVAAFKLIPAIIIAATLPFLAENKEGTAYILTESFCNIYLVIVSVQLVCTILSSVNQLFNKAEKTKNHTLQGVFQMLKIAAICIGAIIIFSIMLDSNPTKILAGLGASAAVLMLVFKDSIMGLVAGVQLSANDMLRPGDWITMPKYNADGFVIDVNLTTIKVQNWDKTIITIPPYALISESFQNWRGMWDSGGRRIKRSILLDMNSIRFCSDSQLKMFAEKGYITEEINCNGPVVNLTVFRTWLERWLGNHPGVNSEMIFMVRQLEPTPKGLPLELYFFFNGTNWVPYEHLQSEIFEYLFALLPEFGLKAFQSPAGNDFNNAEGRIPRHLF